jgi:hypothetical protein
MRTNLLRLFLLILLLSCGKNNRDQAGQNNATTKTNIEKTTGQIPVSLTEEQANKLAKLPFYCISTEYPNHVTYLLNDKNDLKEPHEFYPAFHGCFDWHSAVHGYWSLVRLLKKFPGLSNADTIRTVLLNNISKKNILQETAYFQKEQNKHFERTYGWAWLLKLAEEIHTWKSPVARELEQNLQPLADQITKMYLQFLPLLKYPVRVGEHANTAFGLAFAWDYAESTGNDSLRNLIRHKAKEFYMNDKNCPFDWEPSGYDFLSPCFEEIDLMRRVLDKDEFYRWIKTFAPKLNTKEFALKVGEVSDRKDGKLVHLDGLNYSRAWVMYGLAKQYPEFAFLINNANEHVNYSLPNLVNDSYEGSHWLGTFAIYALCR